jgi:hypothetical protein
MKKRFLAVIAVALMIVALMAGCQATRAGVPPEDKSVNQAAATAAPAAESGLNGSDGSGTALPVIDTGDVAASGKKVVYTVDMALEANDAAAAIKDIEATVEALGGYVADSQYEEESSNATSSITVRIPPEKLADFTAHVGTLGKVLNQHLSSQDVTDQYYDAQARLTNAQAQEAQLLEIMKQATTISDILKVRDELNGVQQEIEQDKGQIRLMDNQVGYSTVEITIQQPPAPAVVVEENNDNGVKFWGFAAVWQKISRGFVSGFNWTLNAISVILMVLAYVILPLAVAGGITIGIIALVRAIRRRVKKK